MFRNWIYKCTYESEWSTCGNEIEKPTRHLLKIPAEVLTRHPFLQVHQGVRTRALQPFKFFDDHGNDIVYG